MAICHCQFADFVLTDWHCTPLRLQIAELATLGCLFLLRVLIGGTGDEGAAPPPKASQRKSGSKAKAKAKAPVATFGLLDVETVTDLYKEALTKFATKKSCAIRPQLFAQLCHRYPGTRTVPSTNSPAADLLGLGLGLGLGLTLTLFFSALWPPHIFTDDTPHTDV